MWKHVSTWLGRERHPTKRRGGVARWVGRGWARLHYATRVEPTWLELTQHQVPIAGLPRSFTGLRIVQLSDFHCSRRVSPSYLAEAVDLALAQAPDLIVLTGD